MTSGAEDEQCHLLSTVSLTSFYLHCLILIVCLFDHLCVPSCIATASMPLASACVSVCVTGIDPITIRQSLSSELVTAAL